MRCPRLTLIVALCAACGGRSLDGASDGGAAQGGAAGAGTGGAAGVSTGGTGGAAGTGTGGTAGTATGGTAGGSPCVSGGWCAPEGASCLEDGCCPCSYTCAQGTWSIAACPGCVAPGCPPAPPADQAACDPCLDAVGTACGYTLADGTPVTAVCDGARWEVAAGSRPCADATTCLSGEVCLFDGGLAPPPGGRCVPDPCAGQALTCGCAATLCHGGPCVGAASGVVRCDCYTC